MTEITEELKLLLALAIPTIGVQISTFLVFTEAASVIGLSLGNEDLGGYSLASLTGNMTCISVIIGVLTASETLSPRAYGGRNYAEVGRLAVCGFVITCLYLSPVMILLCFFLEPILLRLGQNPIEAKLASDWVRIYIIGVPFVLLFRVIQRFLTSQHVVMPLVYSSAIGFAILNPLFLKLLVPTMGFLGSGVAVVLTQISVAMLTLLYCKCYHPHHPGTWVGLDVLWGEALEVERMKEFFRLSLGGVLSLSEWWFWESSCFIAGTLGIVPLCIHSIVYQLVPICFMIPLGLSIGLTVRMASIIETDVQRAKRIAVYSITLTMSMAVIVSLCVYNFRPFIVGLFTKDEEVHEGCKEIWPYVCVYIVLLNIHGMNQGIIRALGLQLRMAFVTIMTLWCISLPLIYYLIVKQNGGLNLLWRLLPITYVFLEINMCLCYVFSDWHELANAAAKKRRQSEDTIRSFSDTVVESLTERSGLLFPGYLNLKYTESM